MENLIVDIKLINQKAKFQAISQDHPEHAISFDYVPPFGDGEGFAGLEMLLMSFGGCVSTGIVLLLKKAGKNIENYSLRLSGIRNEKPLFLKEILFEINIKSNNISAEEMNQFLA